MAGRDRLATFKTRGRAFNANERRQNVKDQRQAQRDKRRTEALAERRGLTVETAIEEPKNRLKNLLEWKKNTKAAATSVKPAFIVSKIKYNDSHLYKPPQSSTFHAPKGVVPVAITANNMTSGRVLRSQNKQTGPNAIKTVLADFASAMKPKTQKTQKLTKKKTKCDLLNRTFDGTQTEQSGAIGTKTAVKPTSQETPKLTEKDPESDILNRTFDASTPVKEPVTSGITRSGKIMLEDANGIEGKRVRKSRKGISSGETELLEGGGVQPGIVSVTKLCPGGGEGEKDLMESDKDTHYFRSLYDEAVKKLNDLCTEWINFQCDEMSDDIHDQVDVAVGYAKLLISQKLKQYADLISEHEKESNGNELKVLASDLEGFWGLVNHEVQDIYKKFDELSFLRENNWQPPTANAQLPKRKKSIAVKPVKTTGKTTSGLRSFLASARKRAKVANDENCGEMSILDRMNENEIQIMRPMSPVVMRVSYRAKQIQSPQINNPPLAPLRSPLQSANRNEISFVSPTPNVKTPRQKRELTPGTPLRRSTRLARGQPEPSLEL